MSLKYDKDKRKNYIIDIIIPNVVNYLKCEDFGNFDEINEVYGKTATSKLLDGPR